MKRTAIVISMLVVASLLLVLPGQLKAASNVSGGMVDKRHYEFTYDATSDDGDGHDWVCVVCYDSEGDIIDVDSRSPITGRLNRAFDGRCGDKFKVDPVLPLSVTFTDPSTPFTGTADTTEHLAYCTAPLAPTTEAGCDMYVNIPDTAVGGTFVADAPVYWAPGKLSAPAVTITAGMSARVTGQDASHMYYQIIWQCQTLWVPASTLGPNYDAVWNGAPLPTGVVD